MLEEEEALTIWWEKPLVTDVEPSSLTASDTFETLWVSRPIGGPSRFIVMCTPLDLQSTPDDDDDDLVTFDPTNVTPSRRLLSVYRYPKQASNQGPLPSGRQEAPPDEFPVTTRVDC